MSAANPFATVQQIAGGYCFKRAIILLGEGCSEYSNIKGLSQIRFKKGSIGSKFGEILQTILREFSASE